MFWIILLCIAFYIIYTTTLSKKETFKSTLSTKDSENAKLILNFFKKSDNYDFVDYINYLTSIKNTNLRIINQETFYEFKTLNKLNKLTLQDIEASMSK